MKLSTLLSHHFGPYSHHYAVFIACSETADTSSDTYRKTMDKWLPTSWGRVLRENPIFTIVAYKLIVFYGNRRYRVQQIPTGTLSKPDECSSRLKIVVAHTHTHTHTHKHTHTHTHTHSSDQKYLESFEMWCWRRMEKISWTGHVRNEVLLKSQ